MSLIKKLKRKWYNSIGNAIGYGKCQVTGDSVFPTNIAIMYGPGSGKILADTALDLPREELIDKLYDVLSKEEGMDLPIMKDWIEKYNDWDNMEVEDLRKDDDTTCEVSRDEKGNKVYTYASAPITIDLSKSITEEEWEEKQAKEREEGGFNEFWTLAFKRNYDVPEHIQEMLGLSKPSA